MLDGMSSKQLYEWEDMFRRWNIGDDPHWRFDLNAATVAAVVANVHRGKGQRSLKITDFMPKFGSPGQITTEGVDRLRTFMIDKARRKKRAQQGDIDGQDNP